MSISWFTSAVRPQQMGGVSGGGVSGMTGMSNYPQTGMMSTQAGLPMSGLPMTGLAGAAAPFAAQPNGPFPPQMAPQLGAQMTTPFAQQLTTPFTGTQMPPGVPGGLQMPPAGGTFPAPVAEESYVENILRLNRGKMATFYMTYENNREWNAKIFRGIIEAAGRDHIIISDPSTGMRFMLLTLNLDYVTFEGPINYQYPFQGATITQSTPLSTTGTAGAAGTYPASREPESAVLIQD